MKNIIGFTNVYYTLWSYDAAPQYRADAYGNNHQCGVNHIYTYIKNVSTDLEKAMSLHPGIEVDQELRGKESSFIKRETNDLPNNIFWGGKYEGRLISEILVSDFKYCLWSMENYSKTREYIQSHPLYLEYVSEIRAKEALLLSSANLIEVGKSVEIQGLTNGYNADDNYTECTLSARYGDIDIYVICGGVKPVFGMYPYLMPVIGGKAQKTKNKAITVNVLDVKTSIEGGNVKQVIWVA